MEFPGPLFPEFYNTGPCAAEAVCAPSVFGWGEHGRVQEADTHQTGCEFVSFCNRNAERWILAEPVLNPLLPPNADCGFPSVSESDLVSKRRRISDPSVMNTGKALDFSRQLGHFSWDHRDTAFQTMGQILQPHYYLGNPYLRVRHQDDYVRMTSLLQSLRDLPYRDCSFSYNTSFLRSFSFLTCDWLQDFPPGVMAPLVREGMLEDWHQCMFQESVTGGSLSWTPYWRGEQGCLIYPRGAALTQLHFQQVTLGEHDEVKLHGAPAVYDLGARVLQVSTGSPSTSKEVWVGVRSSYHLGSWIFSPQTSPRAVQTVSTQTPSTCVNVSPHLPGELCICTESGTLYMWNMDTGLQHVRQDTETLFFHDDSKWRWSDFTSHPRVLTYADRTGIQKADTRVPRLQGMDMFRIGKEASCQRGERVILPRCLRETQPEHYLVTTQFSVYILDERFPLVPLLKWDHMLGAPPTFVQVIPSRETDRSNKILLSCPRSQETVLLQFTGGTTSTFQLLMPALSLMRLNDSLRHFPPLLPHHQDFATQRLACPLAGLAAAQHDQGSMVVFQLTEGGDLFTQKLLYNQEKQKRQCHLMMCEGATTGEDTTGIPCTSEKDATTKGITSVATTKTLVSSEELTLTPQADILQDQPQEADLICCQDSSSTDLEAEEMVCDRQSTDVRSDKGSRHAQLTPQSVPSSTPSLDSVLYSRFHRWLRALHREHKGSKDGRHQRPKFPMTKLFSAIELIESNLDPYNLREHLRESMTQGTLAQIRTTEPSEALESVCPQRWKDPLSQRLTAAWEGHLGLWWDDFMGLNQSSKIKAMRARRQARKLQRARSLSGSFTSSLSFGSDPSSPLSASLDFSELEMSSSSVHTDQTQSFPPTESPSPTSNSSKSTGCLSQQSTFQKVPQDPDISKHNPGLFSSQSLRHRGIPKVRTSTVRDFLSLLGEPSQGMDPLSSSCPLIPLTKTQSQSLSQQTQPSNKRSRMGF
ncbi:TATA box-binding protein-associated factor RNA polymerase I subunit C [Pelodytes ibericus]